MYAIIRKGVFLSGFGWLIKFDGVTGNGDRVKNFSFLMNRSGKWSLAQAYDMILAYDPSNHWLCAHQMTINGKNKNISKDDLLHSGISMDLKKTKCRRIMEEVAQTVGKLQNHD